MARGDGRDVLPTPPPRCAGSPIATSSRRRWPSPTATRFPTTSTAAFAELPTVMARADERGNRVDNAVDNLAEAVLLAGREGELFDGVIVDEDRNGPVMQIAEPAILAHVGRRG